MKQSTNRIIVSLLLAFWGSLPSLAAGPAQRLVSRQPSEPPFVETPQGFMVPYRQRLPGSDAMIEMLPIRGGTVQIDTIESSPDSSQADTPQSVEFGPFWMGKYEITMRQYAPYRRLYHQQRKAEARGARTTSDPTEVDAVTGPTELYDPVHHFEFAGLPDSPVPTVSQFAARQYTKYLSLLTGVDYRLPRRGEWQHACLAGRVSRYHFGDDSKTLARFAVYDGSRTDENAPLRVGTRDANAWGLHDMHGNLSEFVIEDTADQGLATGHVACGGNWTSDAGDCTARSLIRTDPSWWQEDPDLPPSCWWMTSRGARATGFRIIAPLRPMTAEQKRVSWDPDSARLAEDVRVRIEDGRGSVGRVQKYHPSTRRVEQ